MSLLQQQSLVEKNKSVYHTYWYQMKHSLTKNKMPICKHQQMDNFLLISVDFKKMSIPFLNNNKNLFLHSTLFLKNLFLHSTLFLNYCKSVPSYKLTIIVLARVAYEQRYKLV